MNQEKQPDPVTMSNDEFESYVKDMQAQMERASSSLPGEQDVDHTLSNETYTVTSRTAETSRPYDQDKKSRGRQPHTADTTRPYDNSGNRTGRPSGKKLLAGVALSGAIAGGVVSGAFSEADNERNLQNYDTENKIENVAANPDLFGAGGVELPDPKDTVIELEKNS